MERIIMQFFEVPVGQRFNFESVEYLKIPEEKVSCCKIGANALVLSEHTKVVIDAKAEVELIA